MAARKKRPVLYEVYRPRARSADSSGPSPSLADVRDVSRPAATKDGEPAIRPRRESPARPEAEIATSRWQIAISGPTLAVLVAALVVLLAVAFAAGRRYESFQLSTAGVADTTGVVGDVVQASDEQPIAAGDDGSGAGQTNDTPLASDVPPDERADDSPSPIADAQPRQVRLLKGHHYVVVQHFPKRSGRQAAVDAAAYLQEKGVACATLSGADIRLIATEPFLVSQEDAVAARRERQRAEQFMQRIRTLGQQYGKKLAQEGKPGYTFSGCKLFEAR